MSTFRAQKAHKTSKMDSPGPPLRSPRPPWLPPIRAFFTTGEFQLISLPSSPLCAISVPKKGPKRPEFSPPSFFFTHTTHPAPRSPRPLRSLRLCERRSWPPSLRPPWFLHHPCPSAFICGSSSFALFASLREAILPTLSAPSALFASLREAILAALSAPSPLSAVPLPSFPNQVGIFSCSNHPKIPTFRGAPPFFRDYDLLFPLRSPRSRRLASSRAEWDPPARTRAFCKATEPDPILLSSSGSRGNPTFPKGPDFAPCCHFFCDRRRRLETTTPAQSIPVACLHTPTAFLTLTAARCRDSFVYSAKEKEFGRSSPTIALVKPMQPHMEALWFISNSQSTVRNGVGAGISSKGPINSQKEEGER